MILLNDSKPGYHLVLHPGAPAEPRPRPAPRPHLQLAQPAVAAAAVSADHHLLGHRVIIVIAMHAWKNEWWTLYYISAAGHARLEHPDLEGLEGRAPDRWRTALRSRGATLQTLQIL